MSGRINIRDETVCITTMLTFILISEMRMKDINSLGRKGKYVPRITSATLYESVYTSHMSSKNKINLSTICFTKNQYKIDTTYERKVQEDFYILPENKARGREWGAIGTSELEERCSMSSSTKSDASSFPFSWVLCFPSKLDFTIFIYFL